MRKKYLFARIGLTAAFAGGVSAQVTLNSNPSRVLGHAQLQRTTSNPNLVEGRELYNPQSLAIDPDGGPPILYVADTANNRVVAWRDATQFRNGAPADLILGQKDGLSTFPQGPGITGSTSRTGLNSPIGLAVRSGDLYVIDAGNNRILRFPKPFANRDREPDLVVGQRNFERREPNQGGPPAASSLALATSAGVFRASLAFDASGDLWVVDAGNHRVLRYPGSELRANNHGPAANLVIGQPTFETQVDTRQLPRVQDAYTIKDRFNTPSGLAFDSKGRLFVSDSINRVLVFTPPFASGTAAAARVMGIALSAQPAADRLRVAVNGPEGILLIGDRPAVVDAILSRILVFEPFDTWPAESPSALSPLAARVIGQNNDFASVAPNQGKPQPTAASLALPVSAAMQGSELFVVDTGNHRVVVLPYRAENVSFGDAVRVLGQDHLFQNAPNLLEGREFRFTFPAQRGIVADAGLAVDASSDPPRLYIADPYNNRVLAYRDARRVRPGDAADLVLGQLDKIRDVCNFNQADPQASSQDRPNQSGLCFPTGVAVDGEGNLWVADRGNGRVLRFPKPSFDNPVVLPPADLVLGQADFNSRITDARANRMAAPYGLAFTGNNGLLVSDTGHERALYFPRPFTSGMSATKVFGQPGFEAAGAGSATNRLSNPRHIAADTNGRLYVMDAGNNRMVVYEDPNSALVPPADAQPTLVLPLQNIRAPQGVFVSAGTGEVWVADTNGNRLLRYPRYDLLAVQPNPTTAIPALLPLALTQDQFGNLYVADGSHRVAIYYPRMAAVNGATFLRGSRLAPGMVGTLAPEGSRFGEDTKSFNELETPLPMPTELADIQVLFDDKPVPLYYVSPGQINFQVPSDARTSGDAEVQVVRKSIGQVLAAGPVPMNIAAPGLFTGGQVECARTLIADGRCLQIAARNADGTENSAQNPAARETYISLFGTGAGPLPGGPPDGTPAQGPVSTPEKPRVFIGTDFVSDEDVQYSGLAPGLVGVWQINFKIPTRVAPANAVQVFVQYRSINSFDRTQMRPTTVAVKQ